jgi:hypothetical protein
MQILLLRNSQTSLPFAGISDYSAGLETAYKLIKAEKSVSIYKLIQRD